MGSPCFERSKEFGLRLFGNICFELFVDRGRIVSSSRIVSKLSNCVELCRVVELSVPSERDCFK